MGTAPHWDGAGQQLSSLRRQLQQTSTVVIVVCRDLDQATASQWLQHGGQSGPIQTERAQCVVEAPRQRSRCALHMKAEATIAD
jgi:hypothetical protein